MGKLVELLGKGHNYPLNGTVRINLLPFSLPKPSVQSPYGAALASEFPQRLCVTSLHVAQTPGEGSRGEK